MSNTDYDRIGGEILGSVRNELYMNFPYMDVALCALAFQPGAEVTGGIATEGENLYFSGSWLAHHYLRSRTWVNKAYLHVIFHCLLRHVGKARGKDPALWELASDTAVAALFQELHYGCLYEERNPQREKFLAECAAEMKVVTAEGVYRRLLTLDLPKYEVDMLRSVFRMDDHSLWGGESQQERQQQEQQDQKWEDLSEKTMTAMNTMFSEESGGGQAIADHLQVAVRDDVDYRGFLRRFAAPREVVQVDPDTFDYIFYTYGLELYGNMPLVEPLETKEEKRIEDLVIAVDTSMSTSGELVKAFLACTYAILRSTETYTRKVNIHVIQCDNKVRSDDTIHDLDELHEYMRNFSLKGGDSTDFRPVFQHVNELIEEGAFQSLRGLIYFTDGMGFYPKARPAYETAFVFLGQPPAQVPVPSWAIRLVLELPDLQRAVEAAIEEEPEMTDWDELPRT